MRSLIVVWLVLVFCLSSIAYANTDAIVLTQVSGTVSFRDRDNVPYKPAKAGNILQSGWWIKTDKDGLAHLQLPDGSKITVSNNTEIQVSELVLTKTKREGTINITQGKIKVNVSKVPDIKTAYTVKSPTAVAGVRGTEFMMMTHGHANVFFGNEGSVDISGHSQNSKNLTADTFVQNTRGIAPADPIEVKPDTPLAEARENFKAITSAVPPKDWEISNNLPHMIARFNINYARYLAELGRYDEALYVLQIAIDLSDKPEIKADARLQRGTVYSMFMKNKESALAEYLLVVEKYTDLAQRENALYNVAMLLSELGFNKQAKARLLQYKQEYPEGKHISTVNTMLRIVDR